jgi:hypothetical protein
MKFRNLPLILLASGFILATAALHLLGAKAGWLNFRDQHLGTAIAYSRGTIDLLRPVIVGFNANNAAVPQELPLWQAAAALALKLFGPWWGWANVVSLLAFYSALWPFHRLVAAHADERRAWWSVLFLAAQPLVIVYAGLAGTDGFSIAAAIWFLYFADAGLRSGRMSWFIAAGGMGVIAALSKAPFFMAVGITALLLLLSSQARRSVRAWIGLAGAGGAATVAFLIWTKYADLQYAQAEFPLIELRVGVSPEMRFWYFGDWPYRLNPANWLKGGWRFLAATVGGLGLIAVPAIGLAARRNGLAIFSLVGGLVTTAIFSHLVLAHHHYYLMFCGGLAMLSAEGAAWLEIKLATLPQWPPIATTLLAGIILGLSAFQGLVDTNAVLYTDRFPQAVTTTIREHTAPGEKLLIQGGGWGGQILIMADRPGLSIWGTALLENPENLQRLKALGFNKLVMISESPLMDAVQRSRPGGTHRKRELYSDTLTPTARAWPSIWETDDLLIKNLP